MSASEPELAQIPNPASQPLSRVSRRPLPPGPPAATSPARSVWITLAVLGPLAVILAWRVLTLGLAEQWVESDPQRALFWRADHPDALLNAADDDFLNQKFLEAKALGLRALAHYPLDGRSYREMADVADFFGHRTEARRLYDSALRYAPHDLSTRSKLAEYDLKDGQVPQALHQIDMILRLEPQVTAYILPNLVALSQDPSVDAALAPILIARPPWRVNYLTMLAASGTDPDTIDRIFANKGGNDPLPPPSIGTEADLLIARQINDARWSTAYVNWAGTLSNTERVLLGNIYDGGFVFQPSGKGFGWQVSDHGTGFDVLIAPRTEFVTDNVLQVTFNGLPVDYQPVKQMLALNPGHYRLTGMGQAGAMTSEDGLQWVVACAEGQQQVLGKSMAFTGDIAWGPFQLEFDVPDTDCGGQWLRLDLGAGVFRGQPLEGRAIFDTLEITRLGAANSANAVDLNAHPLTPSHDKTDVDKGTINSLK